jgi:simple sugar transport system permease protein
MTDTLQDMSKLPVPTESVAERWKALPNWARWALMAAIGVLILTIVQSISGTDLLTTPNASSGMLRWAMPILLAGLGGLFSERVGVINIGLEGMMILGTWCGAIGAFEFGPWGGLICGLIGGALGGLLHAIATVQFGVDHIISGVAINILAPGLARFLSDRFFPQRGGSISQSPRVDGLGTFTVPGLSGLFETVDGWDIFFLSDRAGLLEGLVTDIRYFTLFGLLLVPASAWLLFRTRLGLRMRICGENPKAGESLGVNIYLHKYLGVVVSGAFAGLAGAFIVIELTGLYRGGQTNGRGFIALAALIFGNWRASGVMVGAMLFGYPFAISLNDFDATGSGVATRALLLVVAIGLAGYAIFAYRKGATKANATAQATGVVGSAMNDQSFMKSPTDSYVSGVAALGGPNVLLAGILASITFLWYLLTDRAADWVPNTMPYALVLVVLVFASQSLKAPAAAGQSYRRGEA